MKSTKKILSLVLATVLLLSVFSIISISANATSKTAQEAADWACAQIGNSIDADGAYGCQCVDLIMKYYDVLGVRRVSGNGYDYINNALPENGWYRTATPSVGDVVVWGVNVDIAREYGHVGIVVNVNGGYIDYVDQNSWEYGAKVGRHNGYLASKASTYIHPNFTDPTPKNNPISALDSVEGRVGSVYVGGWTFDSDNLAQSLYVHVYIGGSSATAGAEGVQISANISRKDVDNVYHVGEFHGFSAVIPTSKSGTQEVYVYAINIGSGENTEIGHKTVYISPDTEKPTCESDYLSMITSESYRVCVVPKDNVGIKSVRIATWTQDDQSDLKWHDALFNGSETYFVDLYRSDYSNKKNSFYHNHIYIYDYAGNSISVACNQDYKITSDTGKSVPEGEYRIVTAVNENKALDVANGSADGGANIQIYNNLISPNQTFNLTYLENGFYHISNSFSGCLLDVYGDTYINNTNVVQCTANGGPNQDWMIKPSGDGYYYIISRTNGLALDLTNADDRDGANVAVHTQNQSAAQKWKLRRVLKDDMVTITGWLPKGGIYQPTAKVVVDGQILTKDVDYTVSSFIDNETLYAKINGIGNYCDSVLIEYKEPEQTVTEPTQPTEPSSSETQPTEPSSSETQPTTPAPKSIKTCTVSGIKAKTYNGKAQTQTITVKDGSAVLKKGTDYTVAYKNNKNAGNATITITGKGGYTGTLTKTFKINKAKNTMAVSAKKTVTAKAGKKTVIKNAVKVNKAQGKVTYKTNNKKVTFSGGKLIVAKGLKKGKTYTVKITITAKGNNNYNSKKIVKSIKIKIIK